jgi:hypothetical protein
MAPTKSVPKTTAKPVAKQTKELKEKKPKDTKEKMPKDTKEKMPKDTKEKKPKDSPEKPLAIPVMRCVTQMRDLLNADALKRLKTFEEENADLLATDKSMRAEIKDIDNIVVNDDDDAADVESKKVAKKAAKDRLANFQKSDLYKTYADLKRHVFRISADARRSLASVVDATVADLVKFGIQRTVENLPSNGGSRPKVHVSAYRCDQFSDICVHPLVSDLKATAKIFENKIEQESAAGPAKTITIDDGDVNKIEEDEPEAEAEAEAEAEPEEEEEEDEDDDDDEDSEKPKPKKKRVSGPLTYKTVVYNKFRKEIRLDEQTGQFQCSQDIRDLISNIIIDFINRVTFYVHVLVGYVSGVSTVTEKHILGALKLMYYHSDGNLDRFVKFETGVDALVEDIKRVKAARKLNPNKKVKNDDSSKEKSPSKEKPKSKTR